MRRKRSTARQAIIYLLLLGITPFMCTAIASVMPKPMEMITGAAINSAEFQSGESPDAVSAVPAAAVPVSTVPADAVAASTTDSKQSFRIITDDSFLDFGNDSDVPSSYNEEAPVKDDGALQNIDKKDESEPATTTSKKADDSDASDNADGNSPEDSGDSTANTDDSKLTGVVDKVTYGKMTGSAYINLDPAGQIRNMTNLDNKTVEKTAEKLPSIALKRDGSPEILIYHTHATESFLLKESDKFDPNFPFRSTDDSINMVAVGNAIAEELRAAGFGVIHDTTLYDEASYNGSYDNSRAGVEKELEENPGIKVVLDVHRDALVKSKTEIVAPTAEIDGKDAAQIMVVSNCTSSELKYPIPQYKENLKLAGLIDGELSDEYPGLMRPILFDYRQYNQDLSTGSLLIEVGGHANSIDEVVYSGHLFGKGLAEALDSLV